MAKTQGAEKELFRTEDFLRLLGKSKAAAGMKPADYYGLFHLAFETSNANVKRIFDSLVEEEKRIDHVDKAYDELIKKAVLDFETGVTDLKSKAKRSEFEAFQKEKQAQDEISAAELLKQINN